MSRNKNNSNIDWIMNELSQVFNFYFIQIKDTLKSGGVINTPKKTNNSDFGYLVAKIDTLQIGINVFYSFNNNNYRK